MMRSLYSGVSGLRVHQTKMDVIGNNIANVNTVGFKSSSVNFSDILYQTTQSASGPNAETGRAGQNAKQIGLGSTLASIKTNITTAGGAQRTDNPFDIMIEGDNFFVVNMGGANYFTKNGAFEVDAAGNLATSFGGKVMGWQTDPNDPKKVVADQVSALRIMTPENMFTMPEATTNTYFSGNIDENDTQLAPPDGKIVQMGFFDSLGNSYNAKVQIVQDQTVAGPPVSVNKNKYSVVLKDIVDADGLSVFVTKTVTGGQATYAASGLFTDVEFGGFKYSFDTVDADGNVTLKTTGAAANFLDFNPSNGTFNSVGANPVPTPPTTSMNMIFTMGQAAQTGLFKTIGCDFSALTKVSTGGVSSATADKGQKDDPTVGRGKKVGNMIGVSIDASGKIYSVYDNGDNKLLGQIATASFANPSGLEAIGNGLFGQTQNSGDFDGIGQDISANGGGFTTGVLEMSNVDLSAQFTDMITTQRGFQANSRIITTSDTLLEELINLKR